MGVGVIIGGLVVFVGVVHVGDVVVIGVVVTLWVG